MKMDALIESRLHNEPEAMALRVTGTSEEPFVEAVMRAHRAIDPTLEVSQLRLRPGMEEVNYELDYIDHGEGVWFPARIVLPEDARFETVAAFFGSDLTGQEPQVRLAKRGPRGGDNFYSAQIAVDVIRAAAEVYGIYVGGRELARFAARWRVRVPFAAVKQWTNTGQPNDVLIKWIQDHNRYEWLPSVLALLLNVDPARCPELLRAAGNHPVTSSGDHWVSDSYPL